jgi:imidazolonepropionase-like amidohydrolase
MQIFRADMLIDGSGGEPQRDMEVRVADGVIQAVLPTGAQPYPSDAVVYDNPAMTMLPGYIDGHVHLMFGTGSRSYDDVMARDSDALMLLRAARNAELHLRAGVTTLRDAGARNRVTFDFRTGVEAGLARAPRMLLCGRPLTVTGGHFWWCNQEADGVDGVRSASRQLLKEGADFIKIMASGGAAQDSWYASYSIEELKAAVDEAHQIGKKTMAHCLAAESIARAIEAGLDQVEHVNFLHPDGSRVFDDRLAEQIVARGIVVSPTIQTTYRELEALEAKGEHLTEEERQLRDAFRYKIETKLEFVRRFHELGAQIVAGTDAIQRFGDFALGLELLHRAGLSPMEVIGSATRLAAKAIGMEGEVGAIAPGQHADLIYIDGDPLMDIGALSRVSTVILGGDIVVDKGRSIDPLHDGSGGAAKETVASTAVGLGAAATPSRPSGNGGSARGSRVPR